MISLLGAAMLATTMVLPSVDKSIPVEARLEIEGWDTLCTNASLGEPKATVCEAYRSLPDTVVSLKFAANGLTVTILSTKCAFADHAVQHFPVLTPLSMALPYAVNKYSGRCQMPRASEVLIDGTSQFENLMYLMVAQR
ncbi:MAG: hypothetical protein FJ335_01475 [Sphingomonadales bacterium]|nr:hypothetical protein [Sphingomonadales bacterium]